MNGFETVKKFENNSDYCEDNVGVYGELRDTEPWLTNDRVLNLSTLMVKL